MASIRHLVITERIPSRLTTIKLRLDARTVITIGNLKALEFWKKRYPRAEVVA